MREKPVSWEPLDQPEGHRQVHSFPLSQGRPRGWTAASCLHGAVLGEWGKGDNDLSCHRGWGFSLAAAGPGLASNPPTELLWSVCVVHPVFPQRSADWASLSALWLMSVPAGFLFSVSFVWFACVVQDPLQGRVLAGDLSGLPSVTGPLSSQLTPAWPDSEAGFTGVSSQLRQACSVLCTQCC